MRQGCAEARRTSKSHGTNGLGSGRQLQDETLGKPANGGGGAGQISTIGASVDRVLGKRVWPQVRG